MKILVTGATGYIGGRLVPVLLDAGHQVRCVARTPAKLDDVRWRDRVEVVEGDLSDAGSLRAAWDGIDAGYFLVHSMGGADDFAEQDRRNASAFRDAAADAGGRLIVYLGGLGDDDDPDLSPHLSSRHEVGRILADGPVPVTELRAAVIIGSGSASFEMLRSLVEVLPAMVTPKWVGNRCQPIAIDDVLGYLAAVLDDGGEGADRVLEVGGPDVLTYADMMQGYARVAGLRHRLLLPVPVLTPQLSSLWIGLVTPLPVGLARPLVESLVNEVVVTDRPIAAVVDRRPIGFDEALHLALDADGGAAAPLPTDPDWSGGRVLEMTHATAGAEPTDPCERPTRMSGTLWEDVSDDGEVRLRFHPRGVAGRLAWYAGWPARRLALRRYAGTSPGVTSGATTTSASISAADSDEAARSRSTERTDQPTAATHRATIDR